MRLIEGRLLTAATCLEILFFLILFCDVPFYMSIWRSLIRSFSSSCIIVANIIRYRRCCCVPCDFIWCDGIFNLTSTDLEGWTIALLLTLAARLSPALKRRTSAQWRWYGKENHLKKSAMLLKVWDFLLLLWSILCDCILTDQTYRVTSQLKSNECVQP